MSDITFVIPFRNEGSFLEATLETLLKQDLDDIQAEIILVDGMSTDNSREIVRKYTNVSVKHLELRLLTNPNISTPAGFNIGIREASAPVIGFGGAHTLYPPHYLSLAVHLLNSVDADVVGGAPGQFVPSERGIISHAMSCLYRSPVGAGVASYRRLKKPRYVDTVFGGFYRREVFDEIGTFNELLVKNQDNELNARVLDAGFKIYYHPDLSTVQVKKTELLPFFKRGFKMSSYHALTWKVNPKSLRLRHIVPAGWCIYLFSLILLGVFIKLPVWVLAPAFLYIMLIAFSGIYFMVKESFLVGIITIPLFIIYHLVYGVGTIMGVVLIVTQAFSDTTSQDSDLKAGY